MKPCGWQLTISTDALIRMRHLVSSIKNSKAQVTLAVTKYKTKRRYINNRVRCTRGMQVQFRFSCNPSSPLPSRRSLFTIIIRHTHRRVHEEGLKIWKAFFRIASWKYDKVMDDVNAYLNDASRQNDGHDDYSRCGTSHAWRTYVGSKTSEDDGARSRQGRENSLREGAEEGEGRLSEVVGGQRRAGVSRVQPWHGPGNQWDLQHTDANSVNQAAQRPTSIMSCSTHGCTLLSTSNRCEILF